MKKKGSSVNVVPVEIIQSKIYLIRGHKVMFDRDLAGLYGVTTSNLNKAVRRNIERFPPDFGFTLTKREFPNLMFQFGTSSLDVANCDIQELNKIVDNPLKNDIF